MNKYFEITAPIRIYKVIGSARSNTYIGTSQVLDEVLSGITAKPGEKILALIGGDFYEDQDGNLFEMRLALPKHVFERRHGGDPNRELMITMHSLGYLREIDKFNPEAGFLSARGNRPVFPSGTQTISAVGKHPEEDAIVFALSNGLGEEFSSKISFKTKELLHKNQPYSTIQVEVLSHSAEKIMEFSFTAYSNRFAINCKEGKEWVTLNQILDKIRELTPSETSKPGP